MSSEMRPGQDTPVVELKALSKTYYLDNIKVEALRDINLRVDKGDFAVLMGPSGCGKSTLLHLLGCLDRPTDGKILLDGIDASVLDKNQLAELRNSRIGFVFQMYNLLPELDILQNVQLPMIYAGIAKPERETRAKELLSEFHLSDRWHHRPAQLSGGERQRAAIARALVNNPSLILADEPTGNLDSQMGKEIMEFFRDLNNKGVTVFLVTHDQEVARYGKRLIKMRDGVLYP